MSMVALELLVRDLFEFLRVHQQPHVFPVVQSLWVFQVLRQFRLRRVRLCPSVPMPLVILLVDPPIQSARTSFHRASARVVISILMCFVKLLSNQYGSLSSYVHPIMSSKIWRQASQVSVIMFAIFARWLILAPFASFHFRSFCSFRTRHHSNSSYPWMSHGCFRICPVRSVCSGVSIRVPGWFSTWVVPAIVLPPPP